MKTIAVVLVLALTVPVSAQYFQTDLVSDGSAPALSLDPGLANPRGITFDPDGTFWVASQVSETVRNYDTSGNLLGFFTVPHPDHHHGDVVGPADVVHNPTSSFTLGSVPARYIAASVEGTITAWHPSVSPSSAIIATAQGHRARYTGLAIGSTGGQDFLYVANPLGNAVDVFNSSFFLQSLTLSDFSLELTMLPTNVQNIGGRLYVSYWPRDDAPDAPRGAVNIFEADGTLVGRLATGGLLDLPWGMALAPPNFAALAESLLIANHGDGKIHAFDPLTGAFRGTLTDIDGNPITNENLWGLTFPRDATPSLYLTAGINDERGGLVARNEVIPLPSMIFIAPAVLAIAGAVTLRSGGITRQRVRSQGR